MNTSKHYRNNIIQFIFVDLPIFILILNFVLYSVFNVDNAKNILRIFSFILFICGWIINGEYKFTVEQLFIMFISIILFLFQGTSALNFLSVVIFAFSTKIDLNTLVKKVFKINVFYALLILFCLYGGLISNTIYVDTVGRTRNTMGFINPNAGALFYSSIIYLYILSRNRIRITDYTLALIGNILIFYYSNSRTSFFALNFYLLMIPIFNRFVNKPIVKKEICIFNDLLWLMGIISLFILNIFLDFDFVLSNRISNYMQFMEQAGIWGAIIGGGELPQITVDNFYFMFLYQSGIFIYLLSMYLVHKSTYFLTNRRESKILAFMTAMFLMGITESSFLRPEIPVTLILWKILLALNSLEGQCQELPD
ncbi:hypothetical protein [Acidaminococcus fermentans]|uniref:hypothetical protein n=1 Tax=Acidaminococcus fermentans TaxID=905 RepID=UPI002431DBD7|nr:hypothetical protein [Acidaminococcus fermentans]